MRPFALFGRVRGKPAAISSHQRCCTAPFSVPVPCYVSGGFSCLVFIVFIITFVLNCDAKVQTYLETCKHFPEKVCIFNLLQQISLFLPKFIHILSTKSIKCAIYKANFFAFAEYPHTNAHVHYIKTNNRLPLYSCCSVLL